MFEKRISRVIRSSTSEQAHAYLRGGKPYSRILLRIVRGQIPERPRRARPVAAVRFECRLQQLPFHFAQRRAGCGGAGGRISRAARLARLGRRVRKIPDPRLAGMQSDRACARNFQVRAHFPARGAIASRASSSVGKSRRGNVVRCGIYFAGNAATSSGMSLAPFAQRRNRQRHHIEPVKKVRAKFALLHQARPAAGSWWRSRAHPRAPAAYRPVGRLRAPAARAAASAAAAAAFRRFRRAAAFRVSASSNFPGFRGHALR